MLPKSIDGEDFGSDSANTPWGYNQATGSFLSRGDWFLDPAKALAYHATFSGDFSSEYVHNPYLADLGLMGEWANSRRDSAEPILKREEEYERVGDVPDILFPEGNFVIDGELVVIYGAADKYCCAVEIDLSELIDYFNDNRCKT